MKSALYYPAQSQVMRAQRQTPETARMADAAKHLRRSADRLADIRGEGALVTQLRAEAARLDRKRKSLLREQTQ